MKRRSITCFEVLNLRQRFGQARQDRASGRQLFLLVAGFLLVYAKLFGGLDYLLKLLQAV